MNKHLPVLITLLMFGSFGVVGDEYKCFWVMEVDDASSGDGKEIVHYTFKKNGNIYKSDFIGFDRGEFQVFGEDNSVLYLYQHGETEVFNPADKQLFFRERINLSLNYRMIIIDKTNGDFKYFKIMKDGFELIEQGDCQIS